MKGDQEFQSGRSVRGSTLHKSSFGAVGGQHLQPSSSEASVLTKSAKFSQGGQIPGSAFPEFLPGFFWAFGGEFIARVSQFSKQGNNPKEQLYSSQK